MKKIVSVFCVVCLLFSFAACDKIPIISGGGGKNKDFVVPKDIMTTEEYHKAMDNLLNVENLSAATSDYMAEVDRIEAKLEEQIRYNLEDVKECTGTKYYLSNSGSDENDGKSEKKPWATLDKLAAAKLKPGDLILFERGSEFRGFVCPISGVTYAAYGYGPKPKIMAAVDGLAEDCVWTETSTKNVWECSKRITQKDMGYVYLQTKDGEDIMCALKYKLSDVKKNYDFCFAGTMLKEGTKNFHVYLYYDGGNPSKVFERIELPMKTAIFNESVQLLEDVHLNNLELLYGTGPFWPSDCRNCSLTYCVCAFSGGFTGTSGDTRMGGGGGCWGFCDNYLWDHCIINQQFDSGVSPQFKGPHEGVVCYKDFVTTNCIFKGCKWTLEYWLDQGETLDDKIEGLIFNYNLCRDSMNGFNPNKGEGAYVQNWGYQNSAYDSEIMHNVFDRAAAYTLSMGASDTSTGKKVLSNERLPKMGGNIYLQKENKKFAMMQGVNYKYTKEDIQKFIATKIDVGSVYLFTE